MPKTVIADGTIVTPAFFNALNNPVFVDTPDNDGEIAKIDDADMSDEAGNLKPVSYAYFNQLLVVEGSSGLQLTYSAGAVLLGDDTAATIAAGAINATDDATSFVHVTTAGVVAVASELPIRCIPMAKVVAAAGVISTIEDLRPRWQVLPRPEEIALNTDESVAILQAPIAQGRLTLATGDPTPSSDQTAATTLYYTPYNGDTISLYNAAADRWDLYGFTERSLDISGLAADTNFDIFIYDDAGTLTLVAVAWSNSGAGTSTRASAISQRNGVWVETSSDRRYLGTIRTTGVAGECEDSEVLAGLWNVQNRIQKNLFIRMIGVGDYTYTSLAWRRAYNVDTYRLQVVSGLPTPASAFGQLIGFNTGGIACGIGKNRTNANDAQFYGNGPGEGTDAFAITSAFSGVLTGFNYLQLLEWGDAAVGALITGDYAAEGYTEGSGYGGIRGTWEY